MSIRADIAVKKRQHLENNNSHNEEQCDKLENQLKEDKFTMGESERKYEDMARKFNTMEGELMRSNERFVEFCIQCVVIKYCNMTDNSEQQNLNSLQMHFGGAKDPRLGRRAEGGRPESPAAGSL